jgi:hypothetical protein
MRAPMIAGAALCLAIGVFPDAAVRLVAAPAAALGGLAAPPAEVVAPLRSIGRAALALIALVGALALLRGLLLRGREVRAGATWGCGYAAPTPRMQYTAASFAEPALAPFTPLLHRRSRLDGPDGYFPAGARAEEEVGDVAGERFVLPLSRRIVDALESVRAIQHGRVQLYVAYVFATVVALLLWGLGGR